MTQAIDLSENVSAFCGSTIGLAYAENGTPQAMPKAVNKKPIFR